MKYKKRDPIVHEPTTQEIFHCLSIAIDWCRILARLSGDKPYRDFLEWLITSEMYASDPDRITVVKLAKDSKVSSRNIKLWITQMYDDIFDLNEASPQLFLKEGTKVSMYFKNFDSFTGLDVSIQSIPRENEQISFPFVKAKVGTDTFYVYRVRHVFEPDHSVEIWVQGGSLNKYREFILDKAEFQGRIGWMDIHHQPSYEIDERLNKIYPH